MNIRTIPGIGYRITIPFSLLPSTSIYKLCSTSKTMKEIDGAMKLITNSPNDNPNTCLEWNGYLHGMSIYSHKNKNGIGVYFTIHIWNIRGSLSLYNELIVLEKEEVIDFGESVMKQSQVDEIREVLQKWNSNKEVKCASCKQFHEYTPSRFWFAATYCKNCWDNGISKQALAEKYD